MAKPVIAKKKPKVVDEDLIGDDVPAAGRKVSKSDNEPSNTKLLRSFIERIQRLEEDKAAVAEDIKEVYGEAKSSGFDVKVIRAIISRMKKDPEVVREFEELVDLYLSELGYV